MYLMKFERKIYLGKVVKMESEIPSWNFSWYGEKIEKPINSNKGG